VSLRYGSTYFYGAHASSGPIRASLSASRGPVRNPRAISVSGRTRPHAPQETDGADEFGELAWCTEWREASLE
jgi:hypothetical protein